MREVYCYRHDYGDRVYTCHGGLLKTITESLGPAALARGGRLVLKKDDPF